MNASRGDSAGLWFGFMVRRFARNDEGWCAFAVLERGPLNFGRCAMHCPVRPELGRWMNGSGGDSAGLPRFARNDGVQRLCKYA